MLTGIQFILLSLPYIFHRPIWMTVVFPVLSTRFPSKFYSIQTMIATILKSSAHFSAVDYNERKVAKGTAQLIEVQNFGFLQGSPNFNADNIKEFLTHIAADDGIN